MKRTNPAASRIRFDYETLKLGRRLTDQQLWCLGVDVREQAFAFEDIGFQYHSRPCKTSGCGRLIGQLPGGGHLSMWGFGFLAGDETHGTLWLDRKGFRPVFALNWDRKQELWDLKNLPLTRAPHSDAEADAALFLLGQLAARMAEYEEDVRAMVGIDARRTAVSQWKFASTALPAEEMPTAWRRIARAAGERRDAIHNREDVAA
jgi:hypothetical protein